MDATCNQRGHATQLGSTIRDAIGGFEIQRGDAARDKFNDETRLGYSPAASQSAERS